jgi:hypothetical protein
MLTIGTNCQNQYFMIDWLIYKLFVFNTEWKRDSLQMMIFLYVCSTCSVFELKTQFESWIEKMTWMVYILFHFFFNNFFGLADLTIGTTCPNQVFYVWLVDLQNSCAKYGLETLFSPNYDIRKYLLDMQCCWNKNAVSGVKNQKWRKWWKLVYSFLI